MQQNNVRREAVHQFTKDKWEQLRLLVSAWALDSLKNLGATIARAVIEELEKVIKKLSAKEHLKTA